MNLIKSRKRVADHGEVFTPAWLVDAMLDLVKDESERIDSRFLEPACGSGNFIVKVLQRKLAAVECKFRKSDFEKQHYALLALMCIYGIELLARKWESALLVNVDNDTLRRIMENPEAMAAVERIEGWRALGDNIIETIINNSDKVKDLKNKAKDKDLSAKEKKELSDEEKEYKSKRKLVQEKLIKFATRIPAFMYLTDFRENTLQDVITKLEPDLFLAVTGLTVKDFHLLVRLKVFNTEQMNQAVFAFRRYEDASLRYTGIESHQGLSHYGLYDTVVAKN